MVTDRLTFFNRVVDDFDGYGVVTTREDRKTVTESVAARQDCPFYARSQLYRFLLVENLRQRRHRHVGNAADGLSAHAARSAQS